eukprot:jgi/Botrbrau1/421/Bobra.110_2s0071.1
MTTELRLGVLGRGALLARFPRVVRSGCLRKLSASPRAMLGTVEDEELNAKVNRVTLKAQDLTPEKFKDFGQVIQSCDDGKPFDLEDAQLVLDRGIPRFYIMRILDRALQFDRITYHTNVTQCLGSLTPEPWYLVVAKPSGSVEAYPKVFDLRAFRIPPNLFVKLEMGTWHAGPLFTGPARDFVNLELSDTNVVDHNTHIYANQGLIYEIAEA